MHHTAQLEGIAKCSGIINMVKTKLKLIRSCLDPCYQYCIGNNNMQQNVSQASADIHFLQLAWEMLLVQLSHQNPMIAAVCSILRLAVLDLVVLLIAPHPLQCFNGLDLCVPLETKCPNSVANSKGVTPRCAGDTHAAYFHISADTTRSKEIQAQHTCSKTWQRINLHIHNS
jgi:hypothetical protein